MLDKRQSTTISSKAIRNLTANTNITFFGQGSIARTLVDSIANELEMFYDTIDLNFSQVQLASASGVFLDIIAAQFGLTRVSGTSGSILAEDKAVRFFTTTGRLIDHMTGGGATTGTIPGGTTITANLGNIVYQVTTDTTFPAGATSVWVPVIPANTSLGTSNNLPSGSLVTHSLTSTNIQVENTTSLITGSDVEADDELRLRISREMNARVTGSKTAVIQAAFNFPGVSDVKVTPYKFGAGSFEILIVPTGSRPSQNVLARINALVRNIVPYGIKVNVRGPDVVPISLVIGIDMTDGVVVESKDVALRRVRDDVRRYLGDIPMGGELIINRLRAVIIDAHNSIRDMRIHQLAIDCRPQVIANWRLNEDEVFDLDTNVVEPLLVV